MRPKQQAPRTNAHDFKDRKRNYESVFVYSRASSQPLDARSQCESPFEVLMSFVLNQAACSRVNFTELPAGIAWSFFLAC